MMVMKKDLSVPIVQAKTSFGKGSAVVRLNTGVEIVTIGFKLTGRRLKNLMVKKFSISTFLVYHFEASEKFLA